MNKDIRFLLFTLIIVSAVGLLSGNLSIERWLMVQVVVLTYVAPSPLDKDKRDD